MPADEVYRPDGQPASSISEAVEALMKAGDAADYYLVRDGSASAWYCVWRQGRKGLARERMNGFITEVPLSVKGGRSGKRERSSSGRRVREVGRRGLVDDV